MNNQRGLTLVELLVVLAVGSMVLVLAVGILMNGINSSKRNTINQQMQQEANYITEVVKMEYLKKYEPAEMSETIQFTVTGDSLKMNGRVISQGYEYIITDVSRRVNPVSFRLTLKKKNQSYKVETLFSKLE